MDSKNAFLVVELPSGSIICATTDEAEAQEIAWRKKEEATDALLEELGIDPENYADYGNYLKRRAEVAAYSDSYRVYTIAEYQAEFSDSFE